MAPYRIKREDGTYCGTQVMFCSYPSSNHSPAVLQKSFHLLLRGLVVVTLVFSAFGGRLVRCGDLLATSIEFATSLALIC